MTDLKTQIKDIKHQLVDLKFLVDFYELYCTYYETGDRLIYSKLQTLSIPLANSYLSRSNNRFKYEGGEEVFEELFSFCYLLLLTTIEKRKLVFPDVQSLYAYFDKRLVLSIQSFYVDEFCNKPSDIREVGEEKLFESEFEISHDYFAVLSVYINIFSSYHAEKDFLVKLANVIVESLLDTSTFKNRFINKYILAAGHNYSDQEIVKLKTRAFSIARCALLFTLNPEIDPHKFLEIKGDYFMLDSQFLYVLSLEDKFPGLLELYHTLGKENMKKVLLLLEGRQVIFPRLKDFNQTQVYVDMFVELSNGATLEELAGKSKVTTLNLKQQFKKRFSGLKNLNHIFEILPQPIQEILNERSTISD